MKERRCDKRCQLGAVTQFRYPLLSGAMITAEHDAILFKPVPHDSYLAVRASRRQGTDSALEAIESIGFVGRDRLKRFVIVIPACVAFWHNASFILVNGRGASPRMLNILIPWLMVHRLSAN
jgi:hypothetical protein